MKIWVNPSNLKSLEGPGHILPAEVWQRLPGLIPEITFDQGLAIPSDADAQLHFYGSFPDGPPAYLFVNDIDETVWPVRSWWPWKKQDAVGYDWRVVDAVGLFVPHQMLADALRERYEAIGPLHVTGHGLPEVLAQFRPADSVTRRITKEVYGREKSFFLAPSTGHVSDNLERLVQAYDLFRQRCSEQVMLLISGTESSQLKAVRRAVKKSAFGADISFLPIMTDAEYWKVYSSARAILYPSLSTRFPVEILKAWHARVPVLATDNDVLGGAGAQVRGEDYKSIAEGMVALVTTPFLASGLVDNGSRRLADFTWGKVAKRVASVLRSADPNL